MPEEITPWDVDARMPQSELRAAVENELPDLASRIAFFAPLPDGTGIYPVDNKHLTLVDGERIERRVEGERFLVRINDMREDPGFYGLFPSNDHQLSEEYEQLMEEAEIDEQKKRQLERQALQIAKERVGKFDELLHKWQKESGDAFILPFFHRYFINQDSDHPLLVTVVQDFSDGYEALTEENDPETFSEVARHTPGLRQELEDTVTAYAKVVGDLPHNASFIPTDIIGRPDQFGLVKTGDADDRLSLTLIDIEPFLDVKSAEMKIQTRQIGHMYKMFGQLPASTPLKPEA